MLDDFTTAYVEAAEWTEEQEGREWSPEARLRVIEDCASFQAQAGDLIYGTEEQAGHDFWLTRNGHGAGFWDGDWPEPAASKLDELSRAFGEVWLYAGDDGLLYV